MRTLLEDEEIVRELRAAAAQKHGARLVDILRVLNAGRVKFIIVSRAAGQTVDFLYRRDTENIRRVVEALLPFNPRLRSPSAGFKFSWDEQSVATGLNFPLATTLGDIDLLGEVNDNGSYEQLLPDSTTMVIFGQRCQCVTLDRLIQIKRTGERPKDFEMIGHMQALREERRKAQLGGNP
jgi:predicted nucleotidyltransferase